MMFLKGQDYYTYFVIEQPVLGIMHSAAAAAAAAAKSLQSCPTLCVPIDGSPPGSPVSGIFQLVTLKKEIQNFHCCCHRAEVLVIE